MADITELEQRLTAALARIGAGLDLWQGQPFAAQIDQAAPNADLRDLFDPEPAARRQDAAAQDPAQDPDLAAEVAHLQRRLDEADLENQRLHSAIAGLRQDLRLMEEHAEAHLAQALRAKETLQAEFDALAHARATETAEIAKILVALAPLIDEEEAPPHAGS